MALKFKKKLKVVDEELYDEEDEVVAPIKKKKKKLKKSGSALVSKKSSAGDSSNVDIPVFLKTGKTAKKLIRKEKEKADQRKAARDANKVMRFFVKPGTERRITFLDGGLDEDGDIIDTCYYEHGINNQSLGYPKFVCTAGYTDGDEDGSCPLCDSENQSYFATVFTVLDHTEWTDREGKDHEGTIMLFVAKPQTAEKLRKKGKKFGGLKGATFDVSRTDKKSAAVGDDFDYIETNKLKVIAEAFPTLKVKALNYSEILPYVPASVLIKMGYGIKSVSVGGEESADEDEML